MKVRIEVRDKKNKVAPFRFKVSLNLPKNNPCFKGPLFCLLERKRDEFVLKAEAWPNGQLYLQVNLEGGKKKLCFTFADLKIREEQTICAASLLERAAGGRQVFETRWMATVALS